MAADEEQIGGSPLDEDFFDDEGAADGEGFDLSQEDPGSGGDPPAGAAAGLPRPRPPPPQPRPPRPGEPGQFCDPDLCKVCQEKKKKQRVAYCGDCNKDVASCLADAKKNNWLSVYNDRAKRDDTFAKMILDFAKSCPTKGQGRARDSFDILRFVEQVYTDKKVRRGTRAVKKDWGEFVDFWKAKDHRKSLKRVQEEWDKLKDSGAEHDEEGRDGMKDCYAVDVEDFIIIEEVSGVKRFRESMTKNKKIKPENQEAFDNATKSGMPGWDDAIFGLGAGTAARRGPGSWTGKSVVPTPSSSSATPNTNGEDDGDAGPGSAKKWKSDPCLRAIDLHNDFANKLQNEATIANTVLVSCKETETEFKDQQETLKLNWDVFITRVAIFQCVVLTENTTAQEVRANLTAPINGYPKEQLKYTPIAEWSGFKTMLDLTESLSGLLSCSEHGTIEAFEKDVHSQLNLFVQFRKSVGAAAPQLSQAKKNLEAEQKRRETAAEAAQKREGRAKKRQEEKAAAARAKAAAKAGGAAPPALPAPPAWSSIFGIPLENFEDVSQLPESLLVSGGRSMLCPERPYLITKCERLRQFDVAQNLLRVQVTAFGPSYPATTACKATGRAQQFIRAEEVNTAVMNMMSEYGPCGSARRLPATMPKNHPAFVFTRGFIYGFESSMNYFGGEDTYCGQTRFQVAGTRQVILTPAKVFADEMASKCGMDTKDMDMKDLGKVLGRLSEEHLTKLPSGLLLKGMHTSESLLYTPPGWLAAERTVNNQPNLGLKAAVVVPENFDFSNFTNIWDRKQKEDKDAKTLQLMTAYQNFIQTGLADGDGNAQDPNAAIAALGAANPATLVAEAAAHAQSPPESVAAAPSPTIFQKTLEPAGPPKAAAAQPSKRSRK